MQDNDHPLIGKNDVRNNQVNLNINPEVISEVGRVLVNWQREKNNGDIEEIRANLPILMREQVFKYIILMVILALVGFFSYTGLINSQFTVALFSAILGYIFGQVGPQYIKKQRKKD